MCVFAATTVNYFPAEFILIVFIIERLDVCWQKDNAVMDRSKKIQFPNLVFHEYE